MLLLSRSLPLYSTLIEFSDSIDLSSVNDIGSYVTVEEGKISIDTTTLVSFANKAAKLTMSNLPYMQMPSVLMDGSACPSTVCSNIAYSNGVLTFDVAHFTTFEASPASTEYNLEISDVKVINNRGFKSSVFRTH